MERTLVTDPGTLGEKFIQWALNQASAPGGVETVSAGHDIELLKSVVGDSYSIPSNITHFKFIQHAENHLVLKLPPKTLVQQSVNDFGNETPGTKAYPLQAFYAPQVLHQLPKDNREFFGFRISDYMTGLCH